MTVILNHHEAQLLKRNEKLEVLWDTDNQLRAMHADWTVSHDGTLKADIENLAEFRQTVTDDLIEMGADPWSFNIKGDNSWMVTARAGVKLVAAQ